jgi:ABC-type nitrate/sulfonate/bicarbonate transport system substrate-binding protein
MSDHQFLSRRGLIGAGASAAVLSSLAACGPKKGPTSSSKIDVVMTAGVSGLTVHEIAKSQGFLTKHGVEPNVLIVSDGAKCVAALLSGAADLCAWSGFNQLTPAIEKGAKIKILAGALNIASLAMYSGKPEIRSVADLKGKTLGIGTLGSVLHQMTVLLLKKKGVDPASVTFRNVGSNADVFKAVVAKTVDAGLSDVDVFDQQEKYKVHALPDGLLWKEIPEYTNQATYASDKAIAERRDLLVRTLAAYGEAYRYVSGPASKDAFVAARKAATSADDADHAVTQWQWIQTTQPYAKDLVLSDERINFVQDLNREFGIQKTILPVAQVADMSLARDALKLI